MKKIGVLVTAYNCEKFVEEALNSLLDQNFPSGQYTIIVIDDGSTDLTLSKIEPYARKGMLRCIANKVNQGLVPSLKAGLPFLNGYDFFMRFDADDIAENNLLSELFFSIGVKAFAHPFMYTFYDAKPETLFLHRVDTFSDFFAAGVLFRTDIFDRCTYNPFFWEEFDLYLQILTGGGEYAVVQKPLLKHRIHGGNMTAREDMIIKGYKELAQKWGNDILEKYNFSLDSVRASYARCFNR
jgi:glycosyltransferase involved in cell wall biosynthesis